MHSCKPRRLAKNLFAGQGRAVSTVYEMLLFYFSVSKELTENGQIKKIV